MYMFSYSGGEPGSRSPIVKTIKTTKAAQPLGHYAQAIEHQGLIYVSMQLGVDALSPDAPPGDIESQTRNAMANVMEILGAAGSGANRIVRITLHLTDMANWDIVNRIFSDCLGDHRPARGVLQTGALHRGFGIAIDAIAAAGPGENA